MKSAWWIKSHKKMRPSPTTRAKSANHLCKSSKSWQKLCKNTQKPSLNSKAQKWSATKSWNASNAISKMITTSKFTPNNSKKTKSITCSPLKRTSPSLTPPCTSRDWVTLTLCEFLKEKCFCTWLIYFCFTLS
jgi:hypothetical protein